MSTNGPHRLFGRRRNRRENNLGFTLVELMVVIAIILLLMTILIPSIHSGLESSRGAICAVRNRDIVTATFQRAANERINRFPHVFTMPSATQVLRKWMWYLWKDDYITAPDSFYCPSFDANQHRQYTRGTYRYVPDFRNDVGDGDFVDGKWGVETTLAFSDYMSNRIISSIPEPHKAPVVMDCLFYRVNRPGDWNIWYDPVARHKNRISVGYADGAVRRTDMLFMYQTPYL